MDHVNYRNIMSKVQRITAGDVIYVVSDIFRLAKCAVEHGESFSPDEFIDTILEKVGDTGTVLIPTFNWDFCQGTTFEYWNSPSQSGALGNTALRRKDFIRTRHPIYSFAVWGRDAKKLFNMKNKNSFGKGSVFDYMHEVDAKGLIIDLSCLAGMTYMHHIEQMVGVPYRYSKNFSAKYIDHERNETIKSFSMYVRDLDLDPKHLGDFDVLSEIMEKLNISQTQYFNDIPFRTLILRETEAIIRADILYNDSRNMYKYNGQWEGRLDE